MTIRCKLLSLSRLFRKTRKNFAFKSREKPQSTNVFSRSGGFFARHQRVALFRLEESLRRFIYGAYFPSHLSIRPDSPCHKLMEHGVGLAEGFDSPKFKNVYCLRN